MSLSRCIECDALVDTDADPDCYSDHHGNDTPCMCYWCRESAQADDEEF